ncbi:MAG: RNA polymerase sigma factor [Saprospiraceae bacterium]
MNNALIPQLFRSEYSKMVAVLCKKFGVQNIEQAEDIVSDTFLLAAETWGKKGLPENPTAWLYTVAKNKIKDRFKRQKIYTEKVKPIIENEQMNSYEIDLSDQNIQDSQLQMMFAICHPELPVAAQIGLSLRILCGFGIDEIAQAFLTNKSSINKRLFRAKDKLRQTVTELQLPPAEDIPARLATVQKTIYLLFNEGYHSATDNAVLRKDFCLEALRLALLLEQYPPTATPATQALIALMCFHASRFAARLDDAGDIVLYNDQNANLWDKQLVAKGEEYMNKAARGKAMSRYHLEAAISYWHTQPIDNQEKWENILQLYNRLLMSDYSPVVALNRTYALYKTTDAATALVELEKLKLEQNPFYWTLLGFLFSGISDKESAIYAYEKALKFVKNEKERAVILRRIAEVEQN